PLALLVDAASAKDFCEVPPNLRALTPPTFLPQVPAYGRVRFQAILCGGPVRPVLRLDGHPKQRGVLHRTSFHTRFVGGLNADRHSRAVFICIVLPDVGLLSRVPHRTHVVAERDPHPVGATAEELMEASD